MRKLAGIILVTGLSACGNTTPVGPEATRIDAGRVSTGPVDVAGAGQSTEEFPFRRILCFGDSLTYGTTSRTADGLATLTAVEGYVPKLARILSGQYGPGLELINQGIGGENSSEGLERLGSELRRFEPDLVLLLEGVIDVNRNDVEPRFPLVRANLADMMTLCIRSNIPVIIGTYPPLNREGFRIQGIDNVPRLNDIIRQEAKIQDVLIADHEKDWNGDTSMQGPDGLHPNDAGYEKMAETWFQSIQDLLARMTTT